MNNELATFFNEVESTKIIEIKPFELKRKLNKTSRVKPSILHYSHLNMLTQYAESHNESKVILTYEFNKDIKYFLTQPATFTIEVDGKKVSHTPDVVIIYNDGTVEFIQIKIETKANDIEYLKRFNQLAEFFKTELGVNYKLVTESSYNEGKYIENLQQLYAFLDVKLISDVTNNILAELPSAPTISELEQLCIKHEMTDVYAWALIAQGHFTYDSSKVLTKKSAINLVH